MSDINHPVTHHYQPSNTSCGPTSLAINLSYYDKHLSPEKVIKEIPVIRNESGDDCGTTGQQLAIWCLNNGYEVVLHTADYQILDLSWSSLGKEKLIERMEEALDARDVPALGKDWSKLYLESYIEFIKLGGSLSIHPYISSRLLDKLLASGPIVTTVNFNVLYNSGRSKNVGLRKSQQDDISGNLSNHFVVLCGKNGGEYLIDDPWKEPGKHSVETERLICAISAAERECDSIVFQIKPKEKV